MPTVNLLDLMAHKTTLTKSAVMNNHYPHCFQSLVFHKVLLLMWILPHWAPVNFELHDLGYLKSIYSLALTSMEECAHASESDFLYYFRGY